MKNDDDILLRLLDGTLGPAEERELRGRLEASPDLRRKLEELRLLRSVLRESTAEGARRALKPLFSDRVLARLDENPEPGPDPLFTGELFRIFRPVAVAGLLAMIALLLYNVDLSSRYGDERTPAESALALPPVTSSAVYDLDAVSITESQEQ